MITSSATPPNPTKPASTNKAANADKELPPKPYTEYTIFFRLERSCILQSSGIIDEEVLTSLDPNHRDPVEFPRPAGYAHLAMPPYWYSSAHKAAIEKKRKHRKRAGRMDLKTLSKTISTRWKDARRDDPVAVAYCQRLARAELEKYKAAVDVILDKRTEGAVGVSAAGEGQPPSNSKAVYKVISSSGTGLSRQYFIFAQAKKQHVDKSFTKQQVDKPVASAAVSGSDNALKNINSLRASFNEVMGYNDGGTDCGPQLDWGDQALLHMLQPQAMRQQLQAAPRQRMDMLCGLVSHAGYTCGHRHISFL